MVYDVYIIIKTSDILKYKTLELYKKTELKF